MPNPTASNMHSFGLPNSSILWSEHWWSGNLSGSHLLQQAGDKIMGKQPNTVPEPLDTSSTEIEPQMGKGVTQNSSGNASYHSLRMGYHRLSRFWGIITEDEVMMLSYPPTHQPPLFPLLFFLSFYLNIFLILYLSPSATDKWASCFIHYT